MTLTNGTAMLIHTVTNGYLLTYMGQGNFTYCEQYFKTRNEAVAFCRERGLRII